MVLVIRALLIVAAAAPALADAVFADTTDRMMRTVPLAPGAAVAVQVTVGRVRIAAWDRAELAIEIVRRVPNAAALARLPIRIDTADEAVTIRAEQTGDGRDAALRADVTLRLPAATAVRDVAVFEGAVELEGLSGRTAVRIERGDIAARDVTGTLRLETVMGDIRLERATLARDGTIRMRTFNGDVTLGLAARPEHARILALSMGGAIVSDLPLTRKEQWGPRWGEVTIGDGEPVISIDVVNGNIAIHTPER